MGSGDTGSNAGSDNEDIGDDMFQFDTDASEDEGLSGTSHHSGVPVDVPKHLLVNRRHKPSLSKRMGCGGNRKESRRRRKEPFNSPIY